MQKGSNDVSPRYVSSQLELPLTLEELEKAVKRMQKGKFLFTPTK